MIVADTSVWIEFLRNNPKVFSQMLGLLERGEILAVECIFGELLQGAKSKREKSIISDYWENLPKVDELGIWISAGDYSSDHKLISKGVGLIDVVILLLARRLKAKVWTSDKKLKAVLRPDEVYS